ncbi:MAG: bifunctional diguanylate cyclase/phosphodiesterase [Arenimonas sp.]|uniref:putative bifunctional diguanylate cyclase/phosphodiesterase n=1 Tax=Arenimonas sp. TaxID=1872635 RepID=UPI0025BCE59D|nr:bifunctional diguanylate cyclase/phosphodiesterase [Arenimonas sp.]MBW8369127.1 bifunctional diguanylate cyclase/phosphodiesterase [Arenimonas sp.]
MMRGTKLFDLMQPHVDASLAEQRSLGVLMLGVQGLRQFNIQHGYESGERLVAKVRALAAEALRPGDVVTQVGPGDFIVLLAGIRDGNHALLAASRVLRQFEQTLDVNGQPVLASVAIGVAVCPEHGATPDALCRQAEAALVDARTSADRMAISPAPLVSAAIEPAELREAIASGQLEMQLQPIWDLKAGRICGAESLARWQHPVRGAISPSVFVAMAESSGMIAEFTRWSINASLQHAAEAGRRGLDIPVSINLSAAAIAERGVVEHLVGALRLWGVRPEAVVIEVTETSIIADFEKGADILGRLNGEGVLISIDDFGVGNASFAYLRQFPATELKIDRSFITGMLGNLRSMQLVKAMIDFAHHIGLRVVAEGVEDRPTLQRLVELGCDHAQGWIIGHPKPAAEFFDSLRVVA